MASHDSCEKLVAAEAGLISPSLVNIPFVQVPRRNGSPNKLTNCLLISVVTVLLVIVSYEIWQAVRREQLIREFEPETVPHPMEQLPLIPKDKRVEEMVEELHRVQKTLNELQEKINRQDPLPTTNELPIIATGEPDDDLKDFTDELLKKLFEESTSEGTEPPSSDGLITSALDSPKYPIFGEDQELENSENAKSAIIIEPIDETESGWRWIFSYRLGGESGERGTNEESNVTGSEETETPNPAETEITNAEEGYWNVHVPEVISNPFRKVYTWTWAFGSSDEDDEDDESSQSEEKVEEKKDSVEIEEVIPVEVPTIEQSAEDDYGWFWGFRSTSEEDSKSSESEESLEEEMDDVEAETTTSVSVQTETTVKESSEAYDDWTWGFGNWDVEDSKSSESEEKVEEDKKDSVESTTSVPPELIAYGKESSEAYDDDYLYEDYDSYEYNTPFDHFSDNKSEDTAFAEEYTDDILRDNPSTETILSSTASENTTEILQEETTIGAIAVPSEDEYKDNKDELYRLESLIDPVTLSTLDASPNDEDSGNGSSSSSSGIGSEDSSKQNDLSEKKYASIDDYFEELLRKRLAETELLIRQHLGDEEDEEYMDQQVTGYDDFDPEIPGKFPESFDDWSYISKRSVDTSSEPEQSSRHLTAKELDQKMVLLLQAIDDDNHLIENEVSLAPEPSKYALQTKLNNFYAKMDAVSAHIDRLHERYLRINKLDDDYVSKEFPTEDSNASDVPEN